MSGSKVMLCTSLTEKLLSACHLALPSSLVFFLLVLDNQRNTKSKTLMMNGVITYINSGVLVDSPLRCGSGGDHGQITGGCG